MGGCRKSNLVIGNDMDGATGAITLELGKVEGL